MAKVLSKLSSNFSNLEHLNELSAQRDNGEAPMKWRQQDCGKQYGSLSKKKAEWNIGIK